MADEVQWPRFALQKGARGGYGFPGTVEREVGASWERVDERWKEQDRPSLHDWLFQSSNGSNG